MFSKLKQNICYYKNNFLGESKKNRQFLLVALICIGIGLLFSLKGIKDSIAEETYRSIAEAIAQEDLSTFSLLLSVLVVPAVLSVFIYLLSCNRFLLLLTYPAIIFISERYFRYTICCLANDLIKGLISTVFLTMPIFLWTIFCCVLFFIQLWETIASPCPKKIWMFVPYRCYYNSTKKIILHHILWLFIPNLCYSILIVLLFMLIF